MDTIRIADRLVGPEQPPFIIAEMSGNHNQSLQQALAIVEAAAKAGADALKLQTYTADTMTIDQRDGEFYIDDPNSLWQGESLYQLYQKAYTPWEWHQQIFERCAELGLIAFSTPFDESAVNFLESLDVPCYKIASFENTDLPLIRKAAATGKPLIISTGMASLAELDESVTAAREAGCKQLILLKCTSTYPASAENCNLRTIPHMAELFGCQTGLSDHTLGPGAALASIALGATVVEKHFTLDRSAGGVDADFSIEPAELAQLVEQSQQAHQALGQVRYGATRAEQDSIRHRRSIYAIKDIAAGEALTRENIRIIRPGLGLAPKHFDNALGKKARAAIQKGTALNWELLN